jgi:hypothetical protein
MEIFSIVGGLLGIFGAICATVVPLLFLVALGIYIYRNSRKAKGGKGGVTILAWDLGNSAHVFRTVEAHRQE